MRMRGIVSRSRDLANCLHSHHVLEYSTRTPDGRMAALLRTENKTLALMLIRTKTQATHNV